MKIFISYRRKDSIHAAHRVRMFLEQRFGSDSVFIDRAIPPGKKWEDHLDEMLEKCDGMVVLVGDDFLRRLNHHVQAGTCEPDPMAWEISTAIKMGKPIYPVLFGALDMPTPAQLPETIRQFAAFQAIFAREPSFDVAMNVLANSLRENHGVDFVNPTQDQQNGNCGHISTNTTLPLLIYFTAAIAFIWLCGRVSIILGEHPVSDRDINVISILIGSKYILLTTLLGLIPYLSYWLISVLRARARLPIRNTTGILSIGCMACAMAISGLFLTLSSIPGWRLHPLFIFPEDPTLLDYSILATGMLSIVLLSTLIILEPSIRRSKDTIRQKLIIGLNVVQSIVLLSELWIIASLITSFPFPSHPDPEPDYIAWLGYFLLLPTISVVYTYGWLFGRKHLHDATKSWEWNYIFIAYIGFFTICTLTLYSIGVGKMIN